MSDAPRSAPLSVAMVTPNFPPQVGGIEVLTSRLADELARIGCAVEVLTQWRRSDAPVPAVQQLPSGVTVRWFRSRTRSDRFPIAPGLARHLLSGDGQYDVVHAHNFHSSPPLLAALSTKKPLVVSPYYHHSGHTPAARLLHHVYDKPAGRIFDRADAIVCCSNSEASLLGASYARSTNKIAVVYAGVDQEVIADTTPHLTDRPVVLMAGRLEEYKHIDIAIRAVPALHADIDLVIIGDGPQRGALAQLARETNALGRVKFLGRVTDEDLRRWLRTASVVLSLSSHESFGLILLEGAAAGASLVASDIPAHREVATLTGDVITIVPIGSEPTTVAGAIERCLRSSPHRSTRRVRLPSWADTAEADLAVYRSVV
jgi:glycosyltransferase involved in cell wall biosynthesis